MQWRNIQLRIIKDAKKRKCSSSNTKNNYVNNIKWEQTIRTGDIDAKFWFLAICSKNPNWFLMDKLCNDIGKFRNSGSLMRIFLLFFKLAVSIWFWGTWWIVCIFFSILYVAHLPRDKPKFMPNISKQVPFVNRKRPF